jgi:hypothetical protein
MKSEHAKTPLPACAQKQSGNALQFFFVVRLLQRRQGRTTACSQRPTASAALPLPSAAEAQR